MRDGKLLLDLSRGVFKNYHRIQSLACWKIGGQIVYIRKRFTVSCVQLIAMDTQCLKEMYNLNMKISPKYHHPVRDSVNPIVALCFRKGGRSCFSSKATICCACTCILSIFQRKMTQNVPQQRMGSRERKTTASVGSRPSAPALRFKGLERLTISTIIMIDAKAVILCGNLNWYATLLQNKPLHSAPEDIDLSDPEKLKLEKSPAMHESVCCVFLCTFNCCEGSQWLPRMQTERPRWFEVDHTGWVRVLLRLTNIISAA